MAKAVNPSPQLEALVEGRLASSTVCIQDTVAHRACLLLDLFAAAHLRRGGHLFAISFEEPETSVRSRHSALLHSEGCGSNLTYINCFSQLQPVSYLDSSEPHVFIQRLSALLSRAPAQSACVIDSLSVFTLAHGAFWATRLLASLSSATNVSRVLFSIHAGVTGPEIAKAVAHACTSRITLHPSLACCSIVHRKRSGKTTETEEEYAAVGGVLRAKAGSREPEPAARSTKEPEAGLTFSVKASSAQEQAAREALRLPFMRSEEEKERALGGLVAALDTGGDSDDPDADLDI